MDILAQLRNYEARIKFLEETLQSLNSRIQDLEDAGNRTLLQKLTSKPAKSAPTKPDSSAS